MEIRTVKHPKTSYSQCQQSAARVLLIVWLLASCSPEVTLATPERQGVMVPATTTSPDTPSLASALPTPPPGGILQLPPDSLGSLWSSSTLPTLPPGGQLPPDSPRSLWSSGVSQQPSHRESAPTAHAPGSCPKQRARPTQNFPQSQSS